MGAVATIFEVLTFLGGIVGVLVLCWVIVSLGSGSSNDVTLAAGSAFAAAVTIIPYCIAGAFHRNAMRRL